MRCAVVHSVFLGLLAEESQFTPLFVVGFEPFHITLGVEVCKFITKVK